ncbi:hypothetical protein D3C86_1587170 [compost metagenome]
MLLVEHPDQFNARKLWHLDINKDEIYGFAVQYFHRFEYITIGVKHMELWNFGSIIRDQFYRQRLIVQDNTVYFLLHLKAMVNSTVKRSFSLVIRSE